VVEVKQFTSTAPISTILTNWLLCAKFFTVIRVHEPRRIAMCLFEVVRLKNGSEEARLFVSAVVDFLHRIAGVNSVPVYELALKCRDAKHSFFGTTEETLKKLNLVQQDGSISEGVRNVVLSAVEIDTHKFSTIISNPIAQS
jgi:hypothetical protein